MPNGSHITDITAFSVPPRWIFVKVATDDGLIGWGEAIVPKRRRAVLGALTDLAANLRGAEASRIEDLAQRMRRGGFFRGGPILTTAAAAIEHALWDILGRRLDVPVHTFLGGPVREHVRVYAWIGGDRPGDPEHIVADARTRIAQGFTAVKMNATADVDYLDSPARLDEVVARVGALRDAFGAELDIALDCHGRVHKSMLKPLFRELEQFRLLWVEEPLAPGHDDLLPELARVAGSVRVATGERVTSRWGFRKLLADGAVDVLQPDVSFTGLFELEKIARMAEAFDVPVVPHCPNGPISLAASLQVATVCANIPLHEQSIGLHYHGGYDGLPRGELHDYLVDPGPLTPEGGVLPVLRGPGLGIEIEEAIVRERDGEWYLPDPDWRHRDGRIAEW